MKTRKHYMYFLNGWKGAAFIIICVLSGAHPLVLLFTACCLVLSGLPSWMSDTYELDNEHLKIKKGSIIIFHEYMIPLSRIEHIEKAQTFTGKLLGFGTLRVTALGGSVFDLDHVPDLNRWYSLLSS